MGTATWPLLMLPVSMTVVQTKPRSSKKKHRHEEREEEDQVGREWITFDKDNVSALCI